MSELSINTTQNVIINFKAASVGERMLASLLDFAVKAAYVIVVLYVFFNLLGISTIMDRLDFWSCMAIIILFFFPVMIYSVTLESIFEGQTIGKKIVKIKRPLILVKIKPNQKERLKKRSQKIRQRSHKP